MSTFIIAAIIVSMIVLVCWLFIVVDHQQKRKTLQQVLTRLSQAGSENSLTFSSQEILKRQVLGVDGVHRKLLILTVMDDGQCKGVVLPLDHIKSCSVKKLYGPINADDWQRKRLEDHVQRIVLQFELHTNERPISVPFYDHADNPVHQCRELEQRAKDWETILSKMLKAPERKRA